MSVLKIDNCFFKSIAKNIYLSKFGTFKGPLRLLLSSNRIVCCANLPISLGMYIHPELEDLRGVEAY
jgi:hypothetical protein